MDKNSQQNQKNNTERGAGKAAGSVYAEKKRQEKIRVPEAQNFEPHKKYRRCKGHHLDSKT